jgi:hypothetical protein
MPRAAQRIRALADRTDIRFPPQRRQQQAGRTRHRCRPCRTRPRVTAPLRYVTPSCPFPRAHMCRSPDRARDDTAPPALCADGVQTRQRPQERFLARSELMTVSIPVAPSTSPCSGARLRYGPNAPNMRPATSATRPRRHLRASAHRAPSGCFRPARARAFRFRRRAGMARPRALPRRVRARAKDPAQR